jgi:hypothetical protein
LRWLGCRPQAPFRLEPEDGVDILQNIQQTIDVGLIEGVDPIDIIRVDWGAVQDRG